MHVCIITYGHIFYDTDKVEREEIGNIVVRRDSMANKYLQKAFEFCSCVPKHCPCVEVLASFTNPVSAPGKGYQLEGKERS